MRSSAVLIGFQEQGNLGIGYVAAMLMQRGFVVRVLDFREKPESIVETIRQLNPVLVGFSLIFQYYVPQFTELASYLRDSGVICHFTAGGHYPTLRYKETLRDVPALDSVVRFEGEITTAELMQCLAEGRDWHQVEGIAYREAGRYVATHPRPLIGDLDTLPFPARPLEGDLAILGKKASPILASRGCCRNCSFCSIRQFYGQAPGRKVRVRNPVFVVQEMKELYEQNGTALFLFQDDDFPVWGAFGRRWVAQFTSALETAGLCGKVLWKVSCRSDEVEPELFARLRDAGLYVVYLGIESGNEAGLRTLNKRLGVEDSLRAVSILMELGLAFTYGFMMFDPSSSFDSIRANVAFLRMLTADGSAPVVFCRMLPYGGTPIEDQLKAEGRLRGSVDNPDYDFTDARISSLFIKLNGLAEGWIQGSDSLANQINFAWQEFWVMTRLFPAVTGLQEYGHFLRSVTSEYNEYLLGLVESITTVFELGQGRPPSVGEVESAGACLLQQLLQGRNNFIMRNQEAMLASLGLSVGNERAATGASEVCPA